MDTQTQEYVTKVRSLYRATLRATVAKDTPWTSQELARLTSETKLFIPGYSFMFVIEPDTAPESEGWDGPTEALIHLVSVSDVHVLEALDHTLMDEVREAAREALAFARQQPGWRAA